MRLIKYILLLLLCVFGSCKKQVAESTSISLGKEIVNILIKKEEIKLNPLKGQWYYNKKPFNGYAVVYHKNKSVSEKIGFFNGKREGSYYKFFKEGSIKNEGYYLQNKLHGIKLNYFKSGKIYSESNYVNGQRHGLQKIWFLNGQLAKRKNLNKGKEEGLQQAWLENGILYVNYEAKNGRIFGMNRANLCYKLKNEKVQYAKKQ
jgi:antitoxin component YwqK of YwqJK toxin-antitoxin module